MADANLHPRLPKWAPRTRVLIALVVLLIAAGAAMGYWLIMRPQETQVSLKPHELGVPTFQGDSGWLKETVIVPTLDTPVPPGKNAIWCASFQLAWNCLKNDVIGEPVKVAGADTVTDRLNGSSVTSAEVLPESCFALAGLATDDLLGHIQQELTTRFPDAPLPEVKPSTVLIAYAYLKAAARFSIPFFENTAALDFADVAGNHTAVGSFGIRREDEDAYYQLRQQVQILHEANPVHREDETSGCIVPTEFAVDPCRMTMPYQVVLAVVPRHDILAATLAELESKMRAWSAGSQLEFGPRDVLLVPNMSWRITHHFRELEGREKLLLNRGFDGLWLETAMQTIEFTLDRGGAELASEGKVLFEPIPRHYVFDRPFLVCLKKRGAEQPFFVLWVENAELLTRFSAGR